MVLLTSLQSAFTCNHWYCLFKDLQGSQKLKSMPQVAQLLRKIVAVFWSQIQHFWCHTGVVQMIWSCPAGQRVVNALNVEKESEATSACSLVGKVNGGGRGGSLSFITSDLENTDIGIISWVFGRGDSSGTNETCVLRAQRAALNLFQWGVSLSSCTYHVEIGYLTITSHLLLWKPFLSRA